MDPRTVIDNPQPKTRMNDTLASTANEARSFVTRATDTVKTNVLSGIDTVKGGVGDAVEFARELPDHVGEYSRALDTHVHQNPRLHVGVMAGVGVLLGAFFGGKIVKWGLLAAAAYGITRLVPRGGFEKLLGEAKSAVKSTV